MENKFRMAIDLILEKKDVEAKKIIREAIQSDARYIAYQEQLKKYGLTFEKVDVPEIVYADLQEVLKPYHKNAQLKIIDELYMMVQKGEI